MDALWKALGMPWEVVGTPWVDVWGGLGDALGGLGGTLEDLLGGPWKNLLEEPSESTSKRQAPKVNLLLDTGALRAPQ